MSSEERRHLLEDGTEPRDGPVPVRPTYERVSSTHSILLPEQEQEFDETKHDDFATECKGFGFGLLTGVCFTSCNVMVKYLPHISSWQLLFVRCILQIVTMVPIILATKSNILGTPDFGTRFRLLLRGLLGGLLLLGLFQGVKSLPLGDATAIFFSCPAFTLIFSTCILRDHCGLFRTFIAVALLSGVVVLCRPPSLFPSTADPANSTDNANSTLEDGEDAHQDEFDLVGVGAAISVPIVASIIVIITRQAKHVHFSVLIIWFAFGGTITAIIGLCALEGNTGGLFQNWSVLDWILTLLVGIIGILGNICMVKALQLADPSRVMVIRSCEVVAAYILQVTVFGVPTHPTDIAGAFLITVAVLCMGLEQKLMQRIGWRFL